LKITLDSTILVRAFDDTGGLARCLLSTILDGNHGLVLSSEILAETSRVLRYPRMQARHGMPESRIYEYVMFLQAAAMMVRPDPMLVAPIRDPNDIVVVQTAMIGGADAICDPVFPEGCARIERSEIPMPRYFAFLRAINVGGHHLVKMEALRAHFEDLGFVAVETFIASGNVIFQAKSAKSAELEGKIERHLERVLGHTVAAFLRTESELAAIHTHAVDGLEGAPVPNIGFLAAPIGALARAALMALQTPTDEFHLHGREMYWLCRTRQSESPVTIARLERAIEAKVTFRGAGTVARLAAKYKLTGA